MIRLKTGPSLALDASSSGDSCFVTMKLKPIPNMPASAAPGGRGGRGHWYPHGLEGARSRQGPPGRAAAGGRAARSALGGGKRLQGWASVRGSKSRPKPPGTRLVTPSKEPQLGACALRRGPAARFWTGVPSFLLRTRGFLNRLGSDGQVTSVTVY